MLYESINYERACAVVDLGAIKENVREIGRRLTPGTKVCAVVKADGYGHGIAKAAEAAAEGGAHMFGVASAGEGAELRRAGIKKKIIVFGAALPHNISDIINNNLISTVYTYEGAVELSSIALLMGRTAEVHIKVDTGMNRIGFKERTEILKLRQLPGLNITGIYSHLAESLQDERAFTLGQFDAFLDTVNYLEKNGMQFETKHISNSGAILRYREFDLDMVRPGTLVYGMQSPEDFLNGESWNLNPALTFLARIIHVKDIRAGETVGYMRTFCAKKDARIATLSVGYADGYSRRHSNSGAVLINGVRAPIAGIICMDQMMADISHIDGSVKPGDYAVLLGASGKEHITACEAAKGMGSIAYEVATSIGKRVPRIYV